jgi:hypothetical protein
MNEQSRKDAMADAETLQLNRRITYPQWLELQACRFYGAMARARMVGGLCAESPSEAYAEGRLAARAAFRAVPSLRT